MRKVNEALRHVLADGVEGLADPGLGFVTITAVRASPDLGHAEVYVSILGTQKRRRASLRALDRAHGVLQGRVAKELHLKRTPQLSFHYDETLDRAMRLNEIMAQDPSAPIEPDPATPPPARPAAHGRVGLGACPSRPEPIPALVGGVTVPRLAGACGGGAGGV